MNSPRKAYWKPAKMTPVWTVCFKTNSIHKFYASGDATQEWTWVGLDPKDTGIAFSYTIRRIKTKDCFSSKKQAFQALDAFLSEKASVLADNVTELNKERKRIRREYGR